jgi:hypothetical protein
VEFCICWERYVGLLSSVEEETDEPHPQLFNITPGLRDMIQEPQKERPPSEDKRDQLPYDSKKRDPQYAGAYGSCLWELVRPSPPLPAILLTGATNLLDPPP